MNTYVHKYTYMCRYKGSQLTLLDPQLDNTSKKIKEGSRWHVGF